MHGRISLLGIALLALGCAETEPTTCSRCELEGEKTASSTFNPAETGKIEGRVVWDGPAPGAPLFTVYSHPGDPKAIRKVTHQPNPHLPQIDPKSGGVRDAVVFVRGIDPAKARPWQHGPALVEIRQRRLRIVQDQHTSGIGFVRQGAEIEVVNRDPEYHSVRARGAAFFSLPCPETDRITKKRLDQSGLVVLGGASGKFWMHAHLFVTEHPYYTRTDAEGRFTFDQVPPGTYQIVSWLPSWHVDRKERDPESGLVARLVFAEPLEQAVRVEVEKDKTSRVDFRCDGVPPALAGE